MLTEPIKIEKGKDIFVVLKPNEIGTLKKEEVQIIYEDPEDGERYEDRVNMSAKENYDIQYEEEDCEIEDEDYPFNPNLYYKNSN